MNAGRIPSRPFFRPNWLAPILICAVAYSFVLGAHLIKLPEYDSVPYNFLHGERLITNMDGYFFLRHARDWAQGQYSTEDPLRYQSRPAYPPPISLIASYMHTEFGLGLMESAFFIPPILGALTAVLLVLVGRGLRSYGVGACAALFSASSHLWMTRTRLGWFDTDCLNLFFFTLLMALTAVIATSRSNRVKLSAFAGLLVFSLLFIWWWPSGAFPFLGIVAMCYVASLLLSRSNKVEQVLKFSLLGMGLALLVLVATGITSSYFPIELKRFIQALHRHLFLAFKQNQTIFPEVGSIIAELTVLPFSQFVFELAGNWGAFIVSLLGLGHMLYKKPFTRVFIGVPVVCLVLLSFTAGNRFIPFLLPAFALGGGWFCICLIYRNLRRLDVFYSYFITIFIVGCLAYPGFKAYLSDPIEPMVDANTARLFEEAGRKSSPHAMIWNQWGPGYSIQYYAKRPTLIDGGGQTPQHVYISEVPFATPDVQFASNWIHFFTDNPGGVRTASQKLKLDSRHTLAFLKKALVGKDSLQQVLSDHGQATELDWWLKFLYPHDRDVTLVFTSDMLFRTVWVSKGLWDPITGDLPETPLYMFPNDGTVINRQAGYLIYDGKVYPYSKIMFVTAEALSHDVKRSEGPIVIKIRGNSETFMIERDFFNNLGFRLLFVHPSNTRGFRPLIYHPYLGGGWKVE